MFSTLFRRLSRCLAAIALALGLAVPAGALTFDQTLRIAEREAPSLAAQAANSQAARSAAIPAGALPDPRLGLGLQNLPVEGPSAWDLDAERMTMQRIGLMQEVPSRAKRRARVELAQAGIMLADAQQAVERLEVQQGAAQAWIAVLAIERKLTAFAELHAQNQLFAKAVDARLAGGAGLAADSVAPRQEAAMLADREDALVREQALARAQLRRWVGEQAGQPLSGGWPKWPVDADEYHDRLQRHPQLQLFDPLSRQAQADIDRAIAEKTPDWSWGVDYLRRGREFGDMVNLSVTFDLPVFAGSRQDPLIEAERASLARVEAQRQSIARTYQLELTDALAEYQRLDRTLNRSEDTLLPLAEEKVRLAMADYRSGRGALNTVIDAREQLIDARLRHIDLARDRSLSNARLYFAFGADHQ
ncbi:TolC family protein [Halopseudomonas salina]|uniref:Transporter n=1 Tax=Halopseudomonas salina TaxID=1323744 RepID=A0ABQ1Q4B5_9GAMM|nr:TolC family protein [Halopseudomonas salina]GGD12388.1 transporter [Halopseudomonas salina]